MAGSGPRESFGYPHAGWDLVVKLISNTIQARHSGFQIAFLRSFPQRPIGPTSLSNVLKRKGNSQLLPVNLMDLAPGVDIPFSAPEGLPCQRFAPEELVAVANGKMCPRVTDLDPKPEMATLIDKKLAERGQTLQDLAEGAGVDLYRVYRAYCLGGWAVFTAQTPEGRQSMDEFHRISTWLDGSPRGARWLFEVTQGISYPAPYNNAPRAAENGHPV